MYYLNNKTGLILYKEGDFNAVFCELDAEGYYQRYLAWLEEGNTPEPWPDPTE